jgi:hypothetical protein
VDKMHVWKALFIFLKKITSKCRHNSTILENPQMSSIMKKGIGVYLTHDPMIFDRIPRDFSGAEIGFINLPAGYQSRTRVPCGTGYMYF